MRWLVGKRVIIVRPKLCIADVVSTKVDRLGIRAETLVKAFVRLESREQEYIWREPIQWFTHWDVLPPASSKTLWPGIGDRHMIIDQDFVREIATDMFLNHLSDREICSKIHSYR